MVMSKHLAFFDHGNGPLAIEEDKLELVAAVGRARNDDPSCQITVADGYSVEMSCLSLHGSPDDLTPTKILNLRQIKTRN